VLLLGALAACRAPEDAFTERVAARVRQGRGDVSVAVKGRLHLELVAKDGGQLQMYLDNLWRQCESAPGACDDDIDRAVAAQGQGTDISYLKPEFVRPLLKDREWLANVERISKEGTPEKAASNAIVARPFVADLYVVYAFDMPDGMRMMTRGDVAALGLDDQQIHALALANMEKAAGPIVGEALKPGSRIRVVRVGDSYEASRVILHDRWKDIAARVDGDLVVAVPARDFVAFTGSREQVAALRVLARRAAAEDHHPLTATLLRWTPGGWEALP
jgi:hypothetical protein